MSKKFDVVIGNPPYQEEAQGGGTRDTPVYHLFMDAAYEVGKKAVLITPARFLFNAGFTPKAWNDEDARRPAPDRRRTTCPTATNCFPARIIKGGIAVTYRDEDARRRAHRHLHASTPSSTRSCTRSSSPDIVSMESDITSSRSYRYTAKLYEDHPDARALRPAGNAALVSTNAFEQFSFLYHAERARRRPEYVRVLGLDREEAHVSLDSQRVRHRTRELQQVQGCRSRRANGSGRSATDLP